jgi:hypothetical protein
MEQGASTERTEGTPQGAVMSRLLANIYLHFASGLGRPCRPLRSEEVWMIALECDEAIDDHSQMEPHCAARGGLLAGGNCFVNDAVLGQGGGHATGLAAGKSERRSCCARPASASASGA